MAEVLIPADGEVALVDALSAAVPVHIGTSLPSPRPAEFGRVVGVGGVARDLVSDSATLTVEAFADTEGGAFRLCALLVAHAQAAGRSGRLGDVTCYGVDVVALPANLPMPTVPDRYRFTATITAHLRRVAA